LHRVVWKRRSGTRCSVCGVDARGLLVCARCTPYGVSDATPGTAQPARAHDSCDKSLCCARMHAQRGRCTENTEMTLHRVVWKRRFGTRCSVCGLDARGLLVCACMQPLAFPELERDLAGGRVAPLFALYYLPCNISLSQNAGPWQQGHCTRVAQARGAEEEVVGSGNNLAPHDNCANEA